MRKIYSERRELVVSGIQTHFSQWLEPIPASSGLHLTAISRSSVDIDSIVRSARQRNMDVRSLRSFFAGGNTSDGLVLGYGATPPEGLTAGLLQLRRLFPAQVGNEGKSHRKRWVSFIELSALGWRKTRLLVR